MHRTDGMIRSAGAPSNPVSRRALLRSGVLATGAVLGGGIVAACGDASAAAPSPTTQPSSETVHNPAQALAALKAGNARFVAGSPRNQGRDSVRRAELAEGQAPFAVVLGCSDSRVTPELLFDQGIGDLFLVRVAGNTGELPILLGSIEYGVGVLGASLIVVLGHEECGAVKAALEQVNQGKQVPGAIDGVLQPIIPAAQQVATLAPDQQLDAAIRRNVELQVASLSGSSAILGPALSDGKLRIVGAEYHLVSGRVEFL